LDKSDAKYVEVIVTDFGGSGTTRLLGHVNFFANGGRAREQPACRANVTKLMSLDFVGAMT